MTICIKMKVVIKMGRFKKLSVFQVVVYATGNTEKHRQLQCISVFSVA